MLKLVMRDGEVFEGETFLDLVSAMKGATMFCDVKNVLEYIAVVEGRAAEMEGINLDVTGEKIDDRCESLVVELERAKLAMVETMPASETGQLARLVQLCADTLYDGDLVSTWPFLRARLRLSRGERNEIEQQLGLATAKG